MSRALGAFLRGHLGGTRFAAFQPATPAQLDCARILSVLGDA
jgi:hypothetical protein